MYNITYSGTMYVDDELQAFRFDGKRKEEEKNTLYFTHPITIDDVNQMSDITLTSLDLSVDFSSSYCNTTCAYGELCPPVNNSGTCYRSSLRHHHSSHLIQSYYVIITHHIQTYYVIRLCRGSRKPIRNAASCRLRWLVY